MFGANFVRRQLPLSVVLLSATSLTPALANCSTGSDGHSVTCSGSVAPVIYNAAGNQIVNVTVQNLTADMTSAGSNSDYIIVENQSGRNGENKKFEAKDIDDQGGKSHTYGKAGSGANAYNQSTTITLNNGYDLKSSRGAIRHISTGADGGNGKEDRDFWSTARGEYGGDGGAGGAITVTVNGGSKDGQGLVSGSSNSVLNLQTTGGAGGTGGEGYHDDVWHNGYGGFGGHGGNGGAITVTFKAGSYLKSSITGSGDHSGLNIVSLGGKGGDGGQGKSGASGYGGTGGAGGNGGAITFTATSTLNSITTSAGHGLYFKSKGGRGGNGGEGSGGGTHPGDGAAGGNGGAITVTYAGQVTTTGDKHFGIFAQSAGGANGSIGGTSGASFHTHHGNVGDPGMGGAVTLTLQNATISTDGKESVGVLAQSVGGFGSTGSDSSGSFSGYGADGGSGGAGGSAKLVLSNSTINTVGDISFGAVVQSVGGGGGLGGSTDAISALGGEGGAGGDAGAVEATLTSTTITTSGAKSAGLIVTSIGGGGGASGGANGVVSHGAKAGVGGNGSTVNVTLDGVKITTEKEHGFGIYAASIGAGGGVSTSASGFIAMGQSGGGGGNGSTVTYTSQNAGVNISTSGDHADGVSLHSIGGGGGKGGDTFKIEFMSSNKMGATGGGGGTGGEINFTGADADQIHTKGANAKGFSAQSVGGGGGDSGAVVTVDVFDVGNETGLGSQLAASGNDGGYVHGSLGGSIITEGHNSTGIYLSSTGGGGGYAGTHVTTTVGLSIEHDLGASGGGGGNGGKVELTSTADVTTSGDNSDGISMQSVGGGGGTSSTVVNTTVGTDLSGFGLTNVFGAKGGSGGNSSDVILTNSGKILVTGANSKGIFLQSQAGGGGKSGTTVTASIGVTMSATLGADGGNGGTAGAVTATNHGSITTKGSMGVALQLQSNGGGGGDASVIVDGTVSGASLTYNHGGTGGNSGVAGDVHAINYGELSTEGEKAYGILAQSIGGGGGSGGMVVNGTLSVGTIGINIGGDGGAGASAGKVTVENHGTISTLGEKAVGILAQSHGGQGGSGGMVVDGTVTIGDVAGSVNVNVGGDGGRGGKADDVKVTNDAKITTTGFKTAGIAAQSTGGSGGSGGSIYAGSITASSEVSLSVNVDVGGSGGAGGKSGNVEVDNSGEIATTGDLASAIYVQSIGGNGGDGGSSYVGAGTFGTPNGFKSNVIIGGSGGDGAVSGTVTVTNTGKLSTTGGNAHAIFAQSIGGNGGDGGSAVGFLLDGEWTKENYVQITANAQAGGGGGKGMHSSAVSVTNGASITTDNDLSYGIYAQSVGGGGGSAGDAGAYSLGYTKQTKLADKKDTENKGYSLSFTLGGSGGAAGDGSTVTVSNSSAIETHGKGSYAIFAQSVGGGGGNGGNGEPDVLNGWMADLYELKEQYEDAKEAFEAFEKISKGEFRDLFRESFSVDIGGKEGAQGKGETVTVTNDGSLYTKGADATAIVAQSVGGGGGHGGDATGGLINEWGWPGSGSGGGAGGDVNVTNTGTITTEGDRAMGIFAQSVGGGGGASGDIETSIWGDFETLGLNLGIVDIAVSNEGEGGDGGDVTVSVAKDAKITTSGYGAHGILAQSVGGGGGGAMTYKYDGDAQSFVVDQAKLGSGKAKGASGVVSVTVDGSVSVSGENAVAVFAQSSAGGDGDSYSKGIVIDVSGTVTASGKSGRAILVNVDESGTKFDANDTSGGVAQITIEKGAKVETTNTDPDETIAFTGGRQVITNNVIQQSNILTNHGEIFSKTFALVTDGKSALRFNNDGVFYGRMSFQSNGKAQNAVNNLSGGKMNLGDSMLGKNANTTFVNAGTLKPGWANDIRTVTVTSGGSFTQTSTGVMSFDTDLSKAVQSGKFILDFDKGGSIGGILTANWIGSDVVQSGASGTLDVLELKAGSGSSFDISKLGTSTAGGAVAYSLDKSSDGTKVGLNYTVDYTGAAAGGVAASRNTQAFGTYFAGAIAAIEETKSEAAATELKALGLQALNATSSTELAKIYEQHVLNEVGNGISRAHAAGSAVHGLLQSCPELDPKDPGGFFKQQECVWAQAMGGVSRQSGTDTQAAYDESVVGVATAAQFEILDDVFLEAGGQYEDVSISGDNFSQDGYRLGAGAALKRELGVFTFSGSLAGGFYQYDSVRSYVASGGLQTANADINGRFLSAEARVYSVLEQGGVYVKPSAALSVTQMWQDAYRETGTGGMNWEVDALSETSVVFRPSLEIGKAFNWGSSAAVAYLRGGIGARLTDPDVKMTSRLSGAAAGLSDLGVLVENDAFEVNLAAGLNAEINDRITFSLQGQSTLAPTSSAIGGFARVNLRF